ncbi:DUF4291 domain-containing protein [Armatimonas rosea]|uniref:DUF4291 domain-containing protein n=1 Tax=Armatimonas rosea TaxID=685828 RepID=A0A7W9ST68_ARMRO|nr:DUF4291 domain-containing protein [Armatimonas rosea]MBB6052392.1 hypothetical protein [Armatimonas rosea]
MPELYAIRATYDKETITVYQAYNDTIADAALAAQTFVAPFSFQRMTWIKPSFLWLMERSNWGQKSGQERILAIRIKRAGWEEALALGVLTHPEPALWPNPDSWRTAFAAAKVHVQWDPERSLRGAALPYFSIQVGLSRNLIQRYTDDWIVGIDDKTPLVRKLHKLIQAGSAAAALKLLPRERVYEPRVSEDGSRHRY